MVKRKIEEPEECCDCEGCDCKCHDGEESEEGEEDVVPEGLVIFFVNKTLNSVTEFNDILSPQLKGFDTTDFVFLVLPTEGETRVEVIGLG